MLMIFILRIEDNIRLLFGAWVMRQFCCRMRSHISVIKSNLPLVRRD